MCAFCASYQAGVLSGSFSLFSETKSLVLRLLVLGLGSVISFDGSIYHARIFNFFLLN